MGKPSFKSAMKMFSKLQKELEHATNINQVEMAEVTNRYHEVKAEKENLERVTKFFNELMGKVSGKK